MAATLNALIRAFRVATRFHSAGMAELMSAMVDFAAKPSARTARRLLRLMKREARFNEGFIIDGIGSTDSELIELGISDVLRKLLAQADMNISACSLALALLRSLALTLGALQAFRETTDIVAELARPRHHAARFLASVVSSVRGPDALPLCLQCSF